MAGHAQLKFVMTKCSKTQIRLAQIWHNVVYHCLDESLSNDLEYKNEKQKKTDRNKHTLKG